MRESASQSALLVLAQVPKKTELKPERCHFVIKQRGTSKPIAAIWKHDGVKG